MKCDRTDLFDSDPLSNADTICRLIFEALAAVGTPNPVLARELSDGVLHFLRLELPASAGAGKVRDVAAKIVRELGYPQLANALTNDALLGSASQIDEWSKCFPPHIIRARESGLIDIDGFTHPTKASGMAVDLSVADVVAGTNFSRATRVSGRFVALKPMSFKGVNPRWLAQVHAIREQVAAKQLIAVWNFNLSAETEQSGLFERDVTTVGESQSELDHAIHLTKAWHADGGDVKAIWSWHLFDRDFSIGGIELTHQVMRLATSVPHWVFVFNRRGSSVGWAAGLGEASSVLESVDIDLAALWTFLQPLDRAPIVFREKCASLARLALDVGHCKLDMLKTCDPSRDIAMTRFALLVNVKGHSRLSMNLADVEMLAARMTEVFSRDSRSLAVAQGPPEWSDRSYAIIDLTDHSGSSAEKLRQLPPGTATVGIRVDFRHPLTLARLTALVQQVHSQTAVCRIALHDISR